MNHVEVNCPICGSDKYSPVYPSKHIVRCAECCLVYLKIRLDEKSMFELYQDYANESSHMRLPKTVDDIKNSGLMRENFMRSMTGMIGAKKGRLLDIGCGWGAFLRNARFYGFDPVGYEVTESCARFGKNILGIDILQPGCGQIAVDLDVVTAIHSLEHLPNPSGTIEYIFHELKPEGWFCGIVPNFGSMCSQHEKENWDWLDPRYHYTYFEPSTLRSVLERFGFENIQMTSTNGDYQREKVEKIAAEYGGSIETSNERMMGEELWFFCRKPELVQPKLSFCITCKNRLYDLKKTLPQNLKDNPEPWIEFVILDYSSDDGVGEWVRENCASEISIGRVAYYRSQGQPHFHMAHSKNCAHKLGRGIYLCNLDADNFTGEGFASYLIENIQAYQIIHAHIDGANGRIALAKEDLNRLGGYDEKLTGYGWDDNDLTGRAKKMGLTTLLMDSKYQQSIPTDQMDRGVNYPPHCSDTVATNLLNQLRSDNNIETGNLVANVGHNWGSIIVQRNWKEFVSI